eukprot:4852709-Ditylum_brightwellii.AAC.1
MLNQQQYVPHHHLKVDPAQQDDTQKKKCYPLCFVWHCLVWGGVAYAVFFVWISLEFALPNKEGGPKGVSTQ